MHEKYFFISRLTFIRMLGRNWNATKRKMFFCHNERRDNIENIKVWNVWRKNYDGNLEVFMILCFHLAWYLSCSVWIRTLWLMRLRNFCQICFRKWYVMIACCAVQRNSFLNWQRDLKSTWLKQSSF